MLERQVRRLGYVTRGTLRARPASSAPASPSGSRQRTEYISCTMNANSYNGKHCQKLNCLYWIIIVTGSWVLHHVGCIQLSPILGLLILFWCVFSWDWCVSLVVFRSKLYLMRFVVLKCKIYLRRFFVVFRGYELKSLYVCGSQNRWWYRYSISNSVSWQNFPELVASRCAGIVDQFREHQIFQNPRSFWLFILDYR